MSPLAPPRRPGCPPALHLEQAAAGDWVNGVRAHTETCAACRSELETLRATIAAFNASHPTERFLGQLERRPASQSTRRGAWVLLAACVALVAIVTAVRGLSVDDAPGVTLKGPWTSITLKRGELQQPLSAQMSLQPGDALRFSVTAPEAGHALVFERDGEGNVAVVVPFHATTPHPVTPGLNVLPDSAVLDGVRGRDSFVFVFSPVPFDVAPLASALARGQTPTCPRCLVQVSTFDKP